MKSVKEIVVASLLLGLSSLHSQGVAPGSEAFDKYWRQGKAELNRFKLSQNRYGETREGDAVLIFVVEDFLPGKQVKYEGRDPRGAGAVPVLKLNQLRKFQTGIYDYSMMLSVFSPLDLVSRHLTLKASASVQDWCGHVWQQVNLRKNGYEVQLHSYFQKEADKRSLVPKAFLVDEVWTRIRLDPRSLPTGGFDVLPSLFQARLLHLPLKPAKALGKRTDLFDGMSSYELRIPSQGRSLKITYETQFPHRIDSFFERWKGKDGKVHETKGVRTHLVLLDYWTRHGKKDNPLRRRLGLDVERGSKSGPKEKGSGIGGAGGKGSGGRGAGSNKDGNKGTPGQGAEGKKG
ncbi:MAG TPA: hypothetical protein ENK02_04850 [Planctomycetes bacterium]|nr:hypothetical protein [Planctomycetota bacterium]